jgi:toxin ParE1/3/4
LFSPRQLKLTFSISRPSSRRTTRGALTFVDDLERKCDVLGRAPGIGTSRPELGDGVRMLPHGRYLIFYREANEGIRIERIMHGARDIGGEDFESDSPHDG